MKNPLSINPFSKSSKHALLLVFGETGGISNIEEQFHAACNLIDVLSAGPTTSRKPERQFIERDADVFRYSDVLDILLALRH
jgi:hypothetical protein